jgi:hypothetical protein
MANAQDPDPYYQYESGPMKSEIIGIRITADYTLYSSSRGIMKVRVTYHKCSAGKSATVLLLGNTLTYNTQG